MKTPFLAFATGLFVLLSAPSVLADPAMPDGFDATWTDDTGLTWRETGTLPLAFTNAVEAVKASMKSQGYSLRHDIFDKSIPDHRLFLFLKNGEELTIMLWRIDAGVAGLSWGVTRTTEPASPASEDNSPTIRSAPPSSQPSEPANVSSNNTQNAARP